MVSVMVTGATGYIGSHVCKLLKNNGYRVVGVDLVRREHTLKHMDQFIENDFNSMACFSALKSAHAVVHCAGTSLVGPSIADPIEYYTNNVAKTAAFLNMIRRQDKPPAFVFSSSAAVYGAPEVAEIGEEQAWNPMSPYGQSKAMVEIMLNDCARAYRMPSMNLRYFNACGADSDGELGQAPGATHIIARLLESVRDNTEFTLNGTDYDTQDGTCIRDYVHVEDLAEAHMLAIEYLLSVGGGFSYTLNLGSGHGYSNREVIDAVRNLVGSIEVVEGKRREGDPDRLVASNFLASAVLGWNPKHDLDSIIKSAWNWYNNPPQSVDNSSK